MQLTHIQLLNKRQVVLPSLLGLAAHAHHTIHADERIGHSLADMRHPLGEQLAVVVPMHYLQHLIIARLQGDMEMRRKMLAVRHKVNHLIRQQVRLTRGDTKTVRIG